MTTTPAASLPTTTYAGASERIVSVARLHFVNKWTAFIVPGLILAGIFLANLAIWAIIFNAVAPEDRADVGEGLQWSGSTFYIFVYTFVIAVTAITVTFPFALGLGITRTHFALGTALALVGLSAAYAIALTVMAMLEEATNGWGFGGKMFTAIYFPAQTWYEFLFVYFAYFCLFFFTGGCIAAIYARWRLNGMLAFFLALAILIVGGIALVVSANAWADLFTTLGRMQPLDYVAWSFVPTIIAALGGFAVLRRATPKG